MNRERILIVIGALVLLSPWSGLPLAWLTWILPVFGLATIAIGFTLHKRSVPAPIVIEEPQRQPHIVVS